MKKRKINQKKMLIFTFILIALLSLVVYSYKTIDSKTFFYTQFSAFKENPKNDSESSVEFFIVNKISDKINCNATVTVGNKTYVSTNTLKEKEKLRVNQLVYMPNGKTQVDIKTNCDVANTK